MPTILAIDTCTEVCSVSLLANDVKINRFVKDIIKSSGLILPLCDEVLKEAGITAADLDGIVYTRGPGAFTGVRMCIGVVQGMSLAHNIPTMGFSTLEVIGFGAAKKYNSDYIAVALDARMGEVYWGVYLNQQLNNESLKSPIDVDVLNHNFIGVGTGWASYESELSRQTGIDHYVADFHPKAENLIDLYLNRIKNNNGFDDKLSLPTYLRNNVAHKSIK